MTTDSPSLVDIDLSACQLEAAEKVNRAAALRDQVCAGDLTVTAADLATADAEAEHAQLRLEAVRRAHLERAEADRLERAAAFADQFTDQHARRVTEFRDAASAARTGLTKLVDAGLSLDQLVMLARQTINDVGALPGRITVQSFGPATVDGIRLEPVTVIEWVFRIAAEAAAKVPGSPWASLVGEMHAIGREAVNPPDERTT